MSIADRWAIAYARQAQADFATYENFRPDEKIPECHKLLFLQMSCEKLVKAHLCTAGTSPGDLQGSHAYIAKTLPIVIRQQIGLSELNPNSAGWVYSHAKHLAREIELLAPAVKRGGQRPDNCEYPWDDGSGVVRIPLDWAFHPSKLLTAPAGRTFLKLIKDAIGRVLASRAGESAPPT